MSNDDSDRDKAINATVGLTVNLGDYNSLRIDAGASIPGDPYDKEDWAKLWEALYAELFEQMDESTHVKQALGKK